MNRLGKKILLHISRENYRFLNSKYNFNSEIQQKFACPLKARRKNYWEQIIINTRKKS